MKYYIEHGVHRTPRVFIAQPLKPKKGKIVCITEENYNQIKDVPREHWSVGKESVSVKLIRVPLHLPYRPFFLGMLLGAVLVGLLRII